MEFLRHFITDEIYVIPEGTESPNPSVTDNSGKPVEQKPTVTPVKEYPLAVFATELSPEEEKLLDGILGAVKLTKKVIQQISSYDEVSSTKVLVFGATPETKNLPLYEVRRSGKKAILISDTLSEVMVDNTKKKKLWTALQQMFGI